MKLAQYIAISIAIFSSIVIAEISIASTDRILVDRSISSNTDLYITQTNVDSKEYRDKMTKYANSGAEKLRSGDLQGGLADFNQIVIIDPKFARGYMLRGLAKDMLEDRNGAIADYRQAAKLFRAQGKNDGLKQSLNYLKELGATENEESNSTNVTKIGKITKYADSGAEKLRSGDLQGGLADFNQIVIIDPEFAMGYMYRGLAKDMLKDRNGAIADYRQAAKLFRAQGENDGLKQSLDYLKELGATEN
jgi:Flp pilus assembly protein TadD